MKTVLLGVSGSISAYKAADITSQLKKKGFEVHVIMTKNSTQFITPLTMQSLSKNIVHIEVMEEGSPKKINHIDLAKEADLFLVAPASANIIGKLANGIADDMLSTVALAIHDMPKLLAPAMNTHMYENPMVQENIKKLQTYGYQIIEPKESLLACGDFGKGALQDIPIILQEVSTHLLNEEKRKR